jgi:hypothetical protein
MSWHFARKKIQAFMGDYQGSSASACSHTISMCLTGYDDEMPFIQSLNLLTILYVAKTV